eukprot:gene12926-5956_t
MRGDPSSLGLICFGMTTAMLMFIETTWTGDCDTTLKPTVIFYALAFGGLGQLIAGILDFTGPEPVIDQAQIGGAGVGLNSEHKGKGGAHRHRHRFNLRHKVDQGQHIWWNSGTVFSSYGCFWIGWGLLEFSIARYPGQFVGATKTGQTLYFGLWALLTLIFFLTALRRAASIQTVLFTLTITFILLAGGVWDASCKEGAGYMGAFCAGSALYAAFIILVKLELGYSLPGIKPNLIVKHPLDYGTVESQSEEDPPKK